jgi:PAS domain S-box-containing protein
MLVQSDAYFNAINAHAIIAVTDVRGVIAFVNDLFCRVSMYGREELVGAIHQILNSGYHPSEFFRELWDTISAGKIWKGELRNRAKDGSVYWMATTIVPFALESGEIYQYVSIRTDVTHLKNLEQQLELEKTSSRCASPPEDPAYSSKYLIRPAPRAR